MGSLWYHAGTVKDCGSGKAHHPPSFSPPWWWAGADPSWGERHDRESRLLLSHPWVPMFPIDHDVPIGLMPSNRRDPLEETLWIQLDLLRKDWGDDLGGSENVWTHRQRWDDDGICFFWFDSLMSKKDPTSFDCCDRCGGVGGNKAVWWIGWTPPVRRHRIRRWGPSSQSLSWWTSLGEFYGIWMLI